jgi:hypothetical protein
MSQRPSAGGAGLSPRATSPRGATDRNQNYKSHETCCILNTGSTDAEIKLTLYFEDRDPQGPYRFTVPGRRTCHKRFNDLEAPAPVPHGVGFSCVIESDVPVVVQHTRLDSRQAENSIMTTIAYPL